MITKSLSIGLLLLNSVSLFSQNNSVQDSIKSKVIKVSYLDSIKKTFVNYKTSDKVDDLWLKELNSLDLYNNLISDIEVINPDTPVDFELPTELLKKRLKMLDDKSPFNIEYNQGLENIIKSFLKNRKRSFEKLMGISQYYFPMFEEAFAKYKVPLEIKYLAVVESALNPKAVSRVGATGLWQFMYHTGKQYKLNIDSYVDERSDALKSSDAAARYMKGMYEIFKDWDLVLASYNSGPGNVSKAIRRSGGLQNYWNIRNKLPRETQGYVPAFLATMYIFEYHKQHGIKPDKSVINHFATDTVAVKNKVTFNQLADLLDMPVSQLEYLNPSYKLNVVPHTNDKLNFIRLPKDKIALFTANESKVYAYANHEFNLREKPFVKPVIAKDSIKVASSNNVAEAEETNYRKLVKKVNRTKNYKVKRGDNLSEIAEKFNVSVAELKQWNHIKKNNVQKGKNLKIVYTESIVVLQKKKPIKNIEKDPKVTEPIKSNTVVAVNDKPNVLQKDQVKENTNGVGEEQTVKYTVKPGDNLYSIATEFKMTVEELRKLNNFTDDKLIYSGDLINVNRTLESDVAMTEIKYKVKRGDNLSSIALKNNVSVSDIIKWNDLQDSEVRVGEKIKILRPQIINLSISTPKVNKVKKKENIKTYTVKSGDSLYSISQKHNITITELKKLNNIKNENLMPGMKLKVNG